MDLITLAVANAYTDKQRIGYSELVSCSVNGSQDPGDYSIPGEILETDGSFERASSEYLHVAGAVESVTIMHSVNQIAQATNPAAAMTNDGILVIQADIFGETKIAAISINSTIAEMLGVPAGTYLWRGNIIDEVGSKGAIVLGIKGYFKETVHKIDPKYLPDGVVGLPVVELVTVLTESESFTNTLTEDDAAQMESALVTKSPVIVSMAAELFNRVTFTLTYFETIESLGFSGAMIVTNTIFGLAVIKNRESGQWQASLSVIGG